MKIQPWILVASCYFAGMDPSAAQMPKTGLEVPELAVIDSAMENLMTTNGITSGSLALARDGTTIFYRTYGWMNVSKTIPVRKDVMMRVASCTKPFTAAAIRKLVTDGELSLTDSVFSLGTPGGGILDHVPFGTPDARLSQITVLHLLQHRGGWDRGIAGDLTYRELESAADMGVASPPGRDALVRWIVGKPLQHTPGSTYSYSNIGYLLLGLIVEKVSGKPCREFIFETILEPLGVRDEDCIMGRSFKVDQDAREPEYDESTLATNVFYPAQSSAPRVQRPYGSFDMEARTGQGRMVVTTPLLVKFLQGYRISGNDIGSPLSTVLLGTSSHTGSLPGTNALARQRSDGIQYSVTFNKRTSSGTAYANQIRTLIDDIISSGQITTWPTRDALAFPKIVLKGAAADPLPATGAILDLGTILVGQPRDFEIRIHNSGDYPLQQLSFQLPLDSPIEILGGPPSQIEPSETATIRLRLAGTQTGPLTTECTLLSDDPDHPEIVLQIQAQIQALAQIQLLDSQGTPLPYTNAALTFGTLGPGEQGEVEVRLRNTGFASLEDIEILFTGEHADMFSVVTPPPPPALIAPGHEAIAQIRLAPTSSGVIQAVARILSSDPTHPEVQIQLSSLVMSASGVLNFSQSLTPVVEDAGEVKLHVQRTSGSIGTATVQIITTDGQAKLGTDYLSPPATFSLEDGQTEGWLVIPLIQRAGREPARTFSVSLAPHGIGSHVGQNHTTTIRILDSSDTKLPSLHVVSPAPNTAFRQPPFVIVAGSAEDNQGVRHVWITLNENPALAATLTNEGTAKAFFSQPLPSQPGRNRLRIQAEDFAGNLSTVTERVFFDDRPLIVSIVGPLGSGRVTNGFMPSSSRRPGTSYSMTATPSKGFIFHRWTANSFDGTGVAENLRYRPTLTFQMLNGLHLTAEFRPNPFATMAGSYTGLTSPENAAQAGIKTYGGLQARITSAGAVSGRLTLDGTVRAFRGLLDGNGTARFGKGAATVALLKTKKRPDISLTFSVAMNEAAELSGNAVVSGGTDQSPLHNAQIRATRAAFHRTNLVNTVLTPHGLGTRASGKFTAALLPQSHAFQLDGTTVLTPESFPSGGGRASMTLTALGSARLKGTLADGTRFTASTGLTADYQLLVFSRTQNGQGILGGQIDTAPSAPHGALSGPSFFWVKPPSSVSPRYPNGWQAGISIDLIGSLFQASNGQSTMPNWTSPETSSNYRIQFSGGPLTEPVTNDLHIAANDTLLFQPQPGFRLKISRSTGLIDGRVPSTEGSMPYSGVIIQFGPQAKGHGFVAPATNALPDSRNQTGAMQILPAN